VGAGPLGGLAAVWSWAGLDGLDLDGSPLWELGRLGG